MKSISKIRQGAEGSGKLLNVSPVKSISSIRDQEKKDDSIEKGHKLLVAQSVALDKEIKKKTKELSDLESKMAEKVGNMSSTGEGILQEAKLKASKILKDAQDLRNETEEIKKSATEVAKKLETKEENLKTLSEEIEQRKLSINNREEKLLGSESHVLENLEISGNKLKSAIEYVSNIKSLYSLAMESIALLLELQDDYTNRLSQNALKTDKIYTEITRTEEIVKSGIEYIDKRSEELDRKEKWIKDRYKALERSSREIKGN